MAYVEIPSDDEVVEALKMLDGAATALALCEALVTAGHPRADSQLGIQRTIERGRILVDRDWRLTLAPAEAIAA